MHREIKRENIFLTAHGPKILDFVLAKPASAPVAIDASPQATRSAEVRLTELRDTPGSVSYVAGASARSAIGREHGCIFVRHGAL
jgi:serine/threonine protein kinase